MRRQRAGGGRSRVRLGVAIALGVAVVALALAGPASAQRWISIDGRVQWLSSQTMMLIPDNGGPPFPVDLSKVSLGDYATLGPGSYVRVTGYTSPDGRKLIATSIAGGGSGWDSQSP